MSAELTELISGYRDPILPLLKDIKRRNNNRIPENCLNEVRAIVDHIARCYRVEDEDRIQLEMSKANGHLQRLAFDCFKQLNIFLYDGLNYRLKLFFSPYLLHLDGGNFWKQIYTLRQDAIANVVKAKENESLDAEVAMQHYSKAYADYIKLESLFDSHKSQLIISMILKYFFWICRLSNWLLFTSLAAIISATIGYLIH